MDAALRESIIQALEPFSLELAIAYGSAAQGRLRPDSDLDVAVLGPQRLSDEARLELLTALERASGRPVDLVDLADAHGTLLAQILSGGVRLVVHRHAALEALYRRHVYEQTDYMPAYRRILEERRARFLR
jgi:predicted nucleotidyltransferase